MQPLPPFPTLDELLQLASGLVGSPAVIVACACALVIVTLRDWRVVLAAFMVMYLALTLLTTTVLPPQWALLRVIVGGLVAIMWYLSAQRAGWGGRFLPFRQPPGVRARPLASTTLLRVLAALVLAAALLVIRPRLPLPPLPPDLRLAITWLAVFALLGLALGEEALQVGTALLMWLAATQLMVGALRRDAWLLWLLSAVEVMVGLATAYLMVARGPDTGRGRDEELR